MNKLIVILIVVVVLLAGSVAVTLFLRQGSDSGTGQTPATTSGGQNINGVTLQTTTGTIKMKDFLHDPVTVKDPANEGYYSIGNHFTDDVSRSVPYVIMYIDATQYFNIGLFEEPIGKNRKDAEKFLMDHLGISESQMCTLKYMVGVPEHVNQEYSAISLGFSFCPGAVPLPE